jgi:tetratricopeptide (TPR) repeat protein
MGHSLSESLNLLYAIVFAVIFVGFTWFSWDMRSILKSSKINQQLSIDGRWKELDDYFKRCERTRRPFVSLHRKYLLPGNLGTQYASFLYQQGRLEEALATVDLAIRQNKNKPRIFRSFHSAATFKTLCGAWRIRILILGSLGRYDEARESAAELQKLAGSHRAQGAVLALVEYYTGHINEALSLAQTVRPEDTQYDAMRGVMANAYSLKGEFPQALEALSYQPTDGLKLYSPAGLKSLTAIPEGAEVVALQRKKLAAIFPPARFLKLATVYAVMEDFEQAHRALDEAEKLLGSNPSLRSIYCRLRACSFAGQGKSKEAEDYIERLRAIVRELPKRSLLWDSHFGVGRAYFYLGRYKDALAELMEAQRSVLHPIEKHATAFWIARTHEAAGNQGEANSFYQMVVADGFPTRMHEQAAAALARAV